MGSDDGSKYDIERIAAETNISEEFLRELSDDELAILVDDIADDDGLEVEATEPDYMDEHIEVRIRGSRHVITSLIAALHVGSHAIEHVPPPRVPPGVPPGAVAETQEVAAEISHHVAEEVVDGAIDDPERVIESSAGMWIDTNDLEDIVAVEVVEE